MDQSCLATLAVVMGLIGLPVGILFRALREENAYLKQLLNRALEVNEGQAEVARELTQTHRQKHP